MPVMLWSIFWEIVWWVSLCRTLRQNYSLWRVWVEEFRRNIPRSQAAPAGSPQPPAHHRQQQQQQHLYKVTKKGTFQTHLPVLFSVRASTFRDWRLCFGWAFGGDWGKRSGPRPGGVSEGINTHAVNTFLSPSMGVLQVWSCCIRVLTHRLWELNGEKWYGEAWKNILNYYRWRSFIGA